MSRKLNEIRNQGRRKEVCHKGGSHKQSRDLSFQFQPNESTFMMSIILSCKQQANKSHVGEEAGAELWITATAVTRQDLLKDLRVHYGLLPAQTSSQRRC